jgi:hypothetical protein
LQEAAHCISLQDLIDIINSCSLHASSTPQCHIYTAGFAQCPSKSHKLAHSTPMAPTWPSSNNRGWWRDYFIDHPGLKSKLPDASTGTGSSAKAKVYCLKCFESHVSAVLAEDQVKVNAVPPHWQAVRAVSDIEAHCKSFLSFY